MHVSQIIRIFRQDVYFAQHTSDQPGKVVGELYRDTGLRATFGSGMRTTESNAVACLQAYIDELRRLPVDLLARL